MSLDTNAPTQRLQWLDAMRGFTMILVVTNHVLGMGLGVYSKTSDCQELFVLFRMPLFFFVSGFLAYKAKNIWTGSFFLSQMLKKLKIQVIPAAIFFSIYVSLFYHDISTVIGSLCSPFKGGYWFTWVLLHMFCIYYILEYVVEKSRHWGIKLNMNVITVIIWLFSVVGYAILYMPPLMKQLSAETQFFLDASSLINTINFLQFFLLGNLVHRNWERVQSLMDSRWFYPIVILIAIISTSEFMAWHNLRFMWRNLPRTIAIYSLLTVIVCFFRHYDRWFTKERVVGRAMQYIGTRTLDIYLLHYFFLPNMPALGRWISNGGNNFVLDLTCGVSLALLIIAFSLVVSNILRVSPFLSEYLFGRKVKPVNNNQ